MAYDVGDMPVLTFYTYDNATGQTLTDATAVVITLTLPDGTTQTPTVTHAGTGTYTIQPTLAQAGSYTILINATGATAGGAYTDGLYVEPATWAGIVSLGEAKSYLGITSSTNDEKLRSLIIAISDAAEWYAGQVFRPRTVTKKFSPGFQGWETILLENDATSIVTVTENGVTLTVDTQYSLDEAGVLWRKSSAYATRSWISGHDNVVVTYVRGSSTIPAALRLAVLDYLRDEYQTQRGPGQGGVAPGGANSDGYQPETNVLPPRIRTILDNLALGGMG
jgi:hypothetical protein